MWSILPTQNNLFSMVKNAHKVIDVKNKNDVVLLIHRLLVKHFFYTPSNFKVIQFLKFVSVIFGKMSFKVSSKLLEYCDVHSVGNLLLVWTKFCIGQLHSGGNIYAHFKVTSYTLLWNQITHFQELYFKMAELVVNCAVQRNTQTAVLQISCYLKHNYFYVIV